MLEKVIEPKASSPAKVTRKVKKRSKFMKKTKSNKNLLGSKKSNRSVSGSKSPNQVIIQAQIFKDPLQESFEIRNISGRKKIIGLSNCVDKAYPFDEGEVETLQKETRVEKQTRRSSKKPNYRQERKRSSSRTPEIVTNSKSSQQRKK